MYPRLLENVMTTSDDDVKRHDIREILLKFRENPGKVKTGGRDKINEVLRSQPEEATGGIS